MENKVHAQRIIDSLLNDHEWETVPSWSIKEKKNTYDIIFVSDNKDITMHYEIDPRAAPGILAEGIAEGHIGPTQSSSKMVDEFEERYIAGLPRRTRRKLERELKKKKYINKS